MKKSSRPLPVISNAEWEVMEVLWATGKALAEHVTAVLEQKRQWNPRTTKTLLNRLLRKKALGFERNRKRYLYFPAIPREACVKAESRSFVTRIFGGDRGQMLCRFVDETKLTEDEIRQLRKILERKAKNNP
jgi:BlaI family penicillinase repressor